MLQALKVRTIHFDHLFTSCPPASLQRLEVPPSGSSPRVPFTSGSPGAQRIGSGGSEGGAEVAKIFFDIHSSQEAMGASSPMANGRHSIENSNGGVAGANAPASKGSGGGLPPRPHPRKE